MSETQDRAHIRSRRLLACGFAPRLLLVVILADGALQTGNHAVDRWGSELSNGDWGWVQIGNLIVTGLLTTAFAVGLRRALGKGSRLEGVPGTSTTLSIDLNVLAGSCRASG